MDSAAGTPSGPSGHLPLSARRAGGGTVLAFLLLCACAPKGEAPAPWAIDLDCAKSFDLLSAAIKAQDLVPAPKDPAEPYLFFSTPDGKASYLLTEPGAPGHPAIMMQRAVNHEVITTGCPYGDKAGYDQLHAYLDGLKSWRRK